MTDEQRRDGREPEDGPPADDTLFEDDVDFRHDEELTTEVPETAATEAIPPSDEQHTTQLPEHTDEQHTTQLPEEQPLESTQLYHFEDAEPTTSYQPPAEPQPMPTTVIGGDEDLQLPGATEEPYEEERPSRRPPLLVWLSTLAFTALMFVCTFIYPPFSGYGEAQHVDLVYSFSNGNAFYDPGDRAISSGVQGAQLTSYPPTSPLTDVQIAARGDRPSFDDLGGDAAPADGAINSAVQHPPLYYLLGAGVLKLIPNADGWPVDRVVTVLRYLSILLLLPLPLLAWATTRALVGNGAAAVAASLLPMAIPGLARVGGSVTNENLLILLTSGLMLVLAWVLAGDLRVRTGVWAGILTGLACLTQGLALVLPVVVIVAYAIAWMRSKQVAWAPLLWSGGLTAAISGWWWIRNVVREGEIQPNGLGDAADSVRGVGEPQDLAQYFHDFFVVLVWRTWGGIGLPEQPRFSLGFSWTWVVVLIVGLLLGLGFGAKRPYGRGAAFVLLLPTLATLALLFLAGRADFLEDGYLPHAQGRYLYPLLTSLAALMAIGYARLFGERGGRWVPLLIVLGGLVTQAWAWRQLLIAWWEPASGSLRDKVRDTIDAIQTWGTWPDAVATSAFIAAAALGTITLLATIGYAVREPDDAAEYRPSHYL